MGVRSIGITCCDRISAGGVEVLNRTVDCEWEYRVVGAYAVDPVGALLNRIACAQSNRWCRYNTISRVK